MLHFLEHRQLNQVHRVKLTQRRKRMMAAKAKADAAEQKIKDGAFAFYETMAANGDPAHKKQ